MPAVAAFGPYDLWELLGRGGMGEVYRAFDRRSGRFVALKLLPEAMLSDAHFVERFRRESHLAARLNDPHVIPIHGFDEVDGRLYIDMRLVDGMDLDGLIGSQGQLPGHRAVALIAQAAQALDAAHTAGLVHRDVKPSNLLVTAQDFVYLVDFGIAQAAATGSGPTSLTYAGSTIGTLAYMAPERFRQQGTIDGRVDVYSLACVLYEALTAQRPFPMQAPAAVMYAHEHTAPPRVTALRPDLTVALDAVLARGMAKDPEHRFRRASELAAAAGQALDVHSASPQAATTIRRAWPLAGDARSAIPAMSVRTPAPPPEPVPPPSWSPPSTGTERGASGKVVAGVALGAGAVVIGLLLGQGQFVGGSTQASGTTAILTSSSAALDPSVADTTVPSTSIPPSASAVPTSAAPSTTSASPSSPPGEPSTAAVSPGDAEALLLDYFLEAGARDYPLAWARLTTRYQAAYGGYGAFVDFWSGIETVGPADLDIRTVDSGPDRLVLTTVVFYDLRTGNRSDEAITVTVIRDGFGVLLIDDYDSETI